MARRRGASNDSSLVKGMAVRDRRSIRLVSLEGSSEGGWRRAGEPFRSRNILRHARTAKSWVRDDHGLPSSLHRMVDLKWSRGRLTDEGQWWGSRDMGIDC